MSSKTRGRNGLRKPSLKTWVCPHRCKLTSTPCPHLEELLPKMNNSNEFESKYKYAGNRVDRALPPVTDKAEAKLKFIKKFGDGLQPVEVDILVLRYVYDEEFGNIAK